MDVVNIVHINSMSEAFNYASGLLLLFLCGTNVAFILEGPDLFHPSTIRFWRLFFIGKTIISAILVDVLFQYPSPFTWRLAAVDIGALISLYSLLIIFRDRSYRDAIKAAELQRRTTNGAPEDAP